MADFGVLGLADEAPGLISPAFAVRQPCHGADAARVQARQNIAHRAVAPCKRLRGAGLRGSLSRPEAGKLQRFSLSAGA